MGSWLTGGSVNRERPKHRDLLRVLPDGDVVRNDIARAVQQEHEQRAIKSAVGFVDKNKAKPNEPLFILRAQDALAADVVAYWIWRAELAGVPKRKIEGARAALKAMKRYPGRKTPD